MEPAKDSKPVSDVTSPLSAYELQKLAGNEMTSLKSGLALTAHCSDPKKIKFVQEAGFKKVLKNIFQKKRVARKLTTL